MTAVPAPIGPIEFCGALHNLFSPDHYSDSHGAKSCAPSSLGLRSTGGYNSSA